MDQEDQLPPRLISIQKRDSEQVFIDLNQIEDLVKSNFSITDTNTMNEVAFYIVDPGAELDSRFEKLLSDSKSIEAGLISKVERDNQDRLKVSYFYKEPVTRSDYRTLMLLFMFSMISVFLAGFFNYSQIDLALQRSRDTGFVIFDVVISFQALIHSVLFTSSLLLLLLVKDFALFRKVRSGTASLSPFYIPAPPIFELGTLGSVYRQSILHTNRSDMSNQLLRWPILSWVLSLTIILLTLPLATYNPEAATLYSEHSILANGKFEPVIFSLLAQASNMFLGTDLNLSGALTQSYIFHPLTLGALAGFYITSFSLLPAAHLTGGYFIRSAFKGKRRHSTFTYLTIFALIFVHWLLASFMFLIHEMLKSPEILNEESKTRSKILLLPFFIILALSFPFNLSFLSLY
ncbi:MAG: hypothetical protein ACXAE3_10785 [Candidatus Kariarchaeaceae archaeon]